jgi:hypothetical protein
VASNKKRSEIHSEKVFKSLEGHVFAYIDSWVIATLSTLTTVKRQHHSAFSLDRNPELLTRVDAYKSQLLTTLAPKRITSSPVAHADVALICELDEQWGFVGSKARQH